MKCDNCDFTITLVKKYVKIEASGDIYYKVTFNIDEDGNKSSPLLYANAISSLLCKSCNKKWEKHNKKSYEVQQDYQKEFIKPNPHKKV